MALVSRKWRRRAAETGRSSLRTKLRLQSARSLETAMSFEGEPVRPPAGELGGPIPGRPASRTRSSQARALRRSRSGLCALHRPAY